MALEIFTKESKNVATTAYDKDKKELFVTFKSFKDPKKLTEYKYSEVPANVWDDLKKAESLGSFVNKNIVKPEYPYEKVD